MKVIITENSIRSDICFDDAEGTACLLNEEIFEGLARMGAKTTAWNEFSSTMASAIIGLADNQKFNFSNYIFDNMVKSLEGGRNEAEVSHDESEDEDHVPTPSSDPLLSAKAAQVKEIADLKKKVSKLNKWRKSRYGGLKRLKKIGSGRRVKSPMEKDGLDAQKDASKQGRMIEEIDQNAEIALDDETQGKTNDDEMFGVDDLAGEEVVMETTNGVKDSAAPTTDVTEDEVTMAQTLAALKSTKPKVVIQEKKMSSTIPTAATIVTIVVPTPRAKAMMDDDRLLAEKLQAREREEFSEVQKARLLVELIEKKNKHFAALRAQEKRNKPPTKTQMKSRMSTYLKHMGGYKQSHLKGRSFDEIKKLFDREMTNVNDFIAMDSEAQESSTKRTTEHFKSDIVVDDSEELRKCIEIVHDDGDEYHGKVNTVGVIKKYPTIMLKAVASQDLWIWHAFNGIAGANNDINVLDNSPLFDDLLDDLALVVPYVVNGVEYRNGYYLADGIYLEWASFVKSFTVATDPKHTYFKQRQKSVRKNVERAFGVLQRRWGPIQQPARAYEVNTLRRIMYASIIMHNMILEDQNMSIVDLNNVYSNPARSMQTMWIYRCETQRRKVKELRDKDTYISLQQNLMNHIWREVGEASEEDSSPGRIFF
nr:protein ALP1-like [Tanacetum cinerariifolium]